MQISYSYDSEVALQTFIFAIIAFLSIFLGLISNRFFKFRAKTNNLFSGIYNTKTIKFLVILCTSISLYNAFSIIYNLLGFGYGSIASVRLNKQIINTFLYDLRYITLIYISYNLLNYKIKDLFQCKPRTYTLTLSFLYLISCLILQTRSIVFELIFIYIYTYFLWNKNKIKFSYVLILILSSISPNLLLLFRVDLYNLSFKEIISSIFQYEYSFTLANLLSANIINNNLTILSDGFTFLSKLYILIPSFFRNIYGIEVNESFYYKLISDLSGVFGGGFSFIGELYANFGGFSYLILFLIGLFIARMISINYSNMGTSSLQAAVYPIVTSNFILSLRNDIFPFIKICIYLFFIAYFMKFISKIKLFNF